jgi:hypothetical protein
MVHHDASTEGMELLLPAPQTPLDEADEMEVVEGEPVSEED